MEVWVLIPGALGDHEIIATGLRVLRRPFQALISGSAFKKVRASLLCITVSAIVMGIDWLTHPLAIPCCR